MTIEQISRPASLECEVTFLSLGVDTLVPVGVHNEDAGDILIVERDERTYAECQVCGRLWLIAFSVTFRPIGRSA